VDEGERTHCDRQEVVPGGEQEGSLRPCSWRSTAHAPHYTPPIREVDWDGRLGVRLLSPPSVCGAPHSVYQGCAAVIDFPRCEERPLARCNRGASLHHDTHGPPLQPEDVRSVVDARREEHCHTRRLHERHAPLHAHPRTACVGAGGEHAQREAG
jgi:hypothetical protein